MKLFVSLVFIPKSLFDFRESFIKVREIMKASPESESVKVLTLGNRSHASEQAQGNYHKIKS